jgi:hydroxyethylthiazole kinase
MITPASLATMLALLSARRPLVHNLTNAVVANFTANALLALGAAPVMAEGSNEVVTFAAVADAVVVNLGMLTPERAAVMLLAATSADAAETPWVLDPVGVGAIIPRTRFAQDLCQIRPTAVRGNASEILSLSGEAGGGRGVDTGADPGADPEAALAAAKDLAKLTGGIVAVTDAVDYVTDGIRVLALHNGHPLMTRVTGMGCAATAIVGACLACGGDALVAVAHALAITGIAGETAAAAARGPGSMQVEFLDALAALAPEKLRVEMLK